MPNPRPRSVTLASIYAGFAGGFLLMTCMNLATNWGSLEVQEQLTDAFEQVPAAANLTVEEFLPYLRWIAIVGAVFSLATIVFAVFTFRGHRGSRIGLTVLSVLGMLLFLSGGLTGFLPALLAALVLTLLWSGPSRAWFKVVNGAEPVALGASPALQSPSERQNPETPPSSPLPSGPGHAWESPVLTHPSPPAPEGMPRSVVIALVLTGMGAFIVGAFASLLLAVGLFFEDSFLEMLETSGPLKDQLESSGQSPETVLATMMLLSALWWGASVFGLVAVAAAFSKRRFAWWLLLAAAVLTIAVGIIGIPLGIIWIAAAVVVLLQLRRPEARAWFR